MLNLIFDFTSAIYVAFCAFALGVQAMAPLFPWHVAMAFSCLIAATGAIVGWSWRRVIFRR